MYGPWGIYRHKMKAETARINKLVSVFFVCRYNKYAFQDIAETSPGGKMICGYACKRNFFSSLKLALLASIPKLAALVLVPVRLCQNSPPPPLAHVCKTTLGFIVNGTSYWQIILLVWIRSTSWQNASLYDSELIENAWYSHSFCTTVYILPAASRCEW